MHHNSSIISKLLIIKDPTKFIAIYLHTPSCMQLNFVGTKYKSVHTSNQNLYELRDISHTWWSISWNASKNLVLIKLRKNIITKLFTFAKNRAIWRTNQTWYIFYWFIKLGASVDITSILLIGDKKSHVLHRNKCYVSYVWNTAISNHCTSDFKQPCHITV